MRISQRGLDAIKRHEGLRLHAYPDPASGGDPWTIGYGRAHGVEKGQTITAETAEQYLREDLQWVEDAIKETVTAPITQGQYDALCSLIYNIGEGAWRGSTMLKRINARQYMQAATEFVRWNKAAGKVMPGLTNRRVLEQKMFESDGEPEIDTSPEPVNKPAESVHVPPRPDQEPYTQEAPKVAIPAIVGALLPAVVELIPSLTKIFKPGSAVAERNVAAAGVVLDTVVKATNAVNAQDAIERMKADPAALAAAAKEVGAWVDLVEVGGGIEGARKADASSRAAGDLLHSPSFWIACLILPLVYLLVLSLIGMIGTATWSDDVRAGLAGSLISAVIGGLVGYYYGQTTSRNRTPAT